MTIHSFSPLTDLLDPRQTAAAEGILPASRATAKGGCWPVMPGSVPYGLCPARPAFALDTKSADLVHDQRQDHPVADLARTVVANVGFELIGQRVAGAEVCVVAPVGGHPADSAGNGGTVVEFVIRG